MMCEEGGREAGSSVRSGQSERGRKGGTTLTAALFLLKNLTVPGTLLVIFVRLCYTISKFNHVIADLC